MYKYLRTTSIHRTRSKFGKKLCKEYAETIYTSENLQLSSAAYIVNCTDKNHQLMKFTYIYFFIDIYMSCSRILVQLVGFEGTKQRFNTEKGEIIVKLLWVIHVSTYGFTMLYKKSIDFFEYFYLPYFYYFYVFKMMKW